MSSCESLLAGDCKVVGTRIEDCTDDDEDVCCCCCGALLEGAPPVSGIR